MSPTTLASLPEVNEEPDKGMKLLAELFELLEMYAPQWYTEEHHRQAQLVLKEFRSH
jgi:hypothetical protein